MTSHDVPLTPTVAGTLKTLSVAELRPNPANPRRLFDDAPMKDLKDNIRRLGVLVPLTVYQLPGQSRFAILDGERRYRCCVELADEGHVVPIPANIVDAPSRVAGLLYMFNIHNFRQQWELMPTALSLQSVMADLQSDDPVELANLTGLNSKTVQRCLLLIGLPERFQSLSLDPNPKSRVPANFWIESDPVIRLVRDELPAVWTKLGYEGILDALVGKYQRRRIRSVIDFRRIVEAYEVAEARRQAVLTSLDHYVTDPEAEIRSTFDQYIVDSRLAQTVLGACRSFIERVSEPGVSSIADEREVVLQALREVQTVATALVESLEGEDQPTPPGDEEETDDHPIQVGGADAGVQGPVPA